MGVKKKISTTLLSILISEGICSILKIPRILALTESVQIQNEKDNNESDNSFVTKSDYNKQSEALNDRGEILNNKIHYLLLLILLYIWVGNFFTFHFIKNFI